MTHGTDDADVDTIRRSQEISGGAMSPEDLARYGESVLGIHWQRPLARALEVDDRLVRRWVSGDRPIPNWVRLRLFEMADEKHRRLGKTLEGSFQDRLMAALQEGRKLMEDARSSEAEFSQAWEKARDTIAETIDWAGPSLRTTFGVASLQIPGEPRELHIAQNPRAQDPDFVLRYEPDKGARQIVCSTVPAKLLPAERYAPEQLDRSAVEAKILNFVEAIFRHRAEKASGRRIELPEG